jgi:hypothetical protein
MKIWRRLMLWIALPLSIVALLAGVLVFAFFHKFYPSAPAATFPPARDVMTAQQQDFDYFRNYLTLNQTYTPADREQAMRLLAAYRNRESTLSPAEFDLAISRMVALADNGHSRVNPGPLSRRHDRIACRLYHFADGFYVVRARTACMDLLGAKVMAIDGRPADEIADRMFRYFAGPRSHYDQFASVFFLESPDLLHAAGLADVADRVHLHVMLRDGIERNVIAIAEPADANAPRVWSDRYLSPLRIDQEPTDWKPLLAADSPLPSFLRNYEDPFQSAYWPDGRVYYIQFRSNDDEPGHPIGEFVSRVSRDIATARPRTILLDLRLDQGGNFTKTASFMSALTKMSDSIEHAYVLTSGWTFSAGDTSLALVRSHGGDKVTVIGEPVGDRVRLWAEGGDVVLPNSKLNIGFATGLHDYTRSCWGEAGCFWAMYLYPMHVATLLPDVRVRYTFDDYVNLRDPVLDRALELARGLPARPI